MKTRRKLVHIALVLILLLVSGCKLNATTPDEDILSLSRTPDIVRVLSAEPEAQEQEVELFQTEDIEPQDDEPEIMRYKSRVRLLNIRSKPDMSGEDSIIEQIEYEQEVTPLFDSGEFTYVRLDDGTEGYCYTDYLVPADETLYAYVEESTGHEIDLRTGEIKYRSDGETPVSVKCELVDMRLYLKNAEYSLIFATPSNELNTVLYPRAIPLMQKGTLDKLLKANEIFNEDGYMIRVYDAYRPLSVQKKLYDKVQNSKWIANPYTTGSYHNRGAAIDMTLINIATGVEMEYPTSMHSFTKEAARSSKTWTDEQRANVDYMTSVMEKCGFSKIESEWWHFSDKDGKAYMITDLDLSRLEMNVEQ